MKCLSRDRPARQGVAIQPVPSVASRDGDVGGEAYTGSVKPCDRAPKEETLWELSAVDNGDDDVEGLDMREVEIPPGSKSTAHMRRGTGKPGRSRDFHRARGRDTPLIKSRRSDGCASQANERDAPTVIPWNEGNEVKRDG